MNVVKRANLFEPREGLAHARLLVLVLCLRLEFLAEAVCLVALQLWRKSSCLDDYQSFPFNLSYSNRLTFVHYVQILSASCHYL